MMKNKPINPSEEHLAWMETLWRNYERNQEQMGRQFEEEHPEVTPLTRLEEIWAWEDYAMREYLQWVSPTSTGTVRDRLMTRFS